LQGRAGRGRTVNRSYEKKAVTSFRNIAFATCLLLALTPTVAQAIDGNKLHEACSNEYDFCLSYVMGVHEAIGWIVTADGELAWVTYCVPPGVTNNRLRDVVAKYLRDNPSKRHAAAVFLVFSALRNSFPCNR
jgi:hypothetical protein